MAQMLNQPAFLIVPSGFSTISVWLRGRFEIGCCANAGRPELARARANVRDCSMRIVSPPGGVHVFFAAASKRARGFSVNRILAVCVAGDGWLSRNSTLVSDTPIV